MKKKQIIITESERLADLDKRQQAIFESFNKEFNKIKRVNENELVSNRLQVKMKVKFIVPDVLNDSPEVTGVGIITGFDSTTFEDYVMITTNDGKDYSVRTDDVQPLQ